MTDGLKDRHRAAIIATIAANDRVERAVLFGSRATGTHSVSSDVDIALIGDRLTMTDQARHRRRYWTRFLWRSQIDLAAVRFDTKRDPAKTHPVSKRGVVRKTHSQGGQPWHLWGRMYVASHVTSTSRCFANRL